MSERENSVANGVDCSKTDGMNKLKNKDDQVLYEITATGIVSKEFRYASNPLESNNKTLFSAYVSNIDRHNQYIYIQPECYMQDMEKLTEELHIYYSHPISEQLLVKDIDTGLACVNKFEGIYHRIYIMENHSSKCVITYVDLGLTEEIKKGKIQFKHLLNYFAEVPCLSIACRLWDIEFKLKNFEMPLETYEQLNALCQCGPFDVEPHGAVNGVLNVKIYNVDKHCLNDILLNQKLASYSSLQIIPTGNVEKQQETQNISSENSKQGSSNHIHEDNTLSKGVVENSNYLFDDYEESYFTEMIGHQQSIAVQIPVSNMCSDYLPDDFSSTHTRKGPQQQDPTAKSTIKSGTQSIRKKLTDIKSSNSTNQRNQQDREHNDDRMRLTISISQDIPSRLFKSALSSLSRNKIDNQRQISHSPGPNIYQKKDDFANWMCSWSIEESLWSSDIYRNALLKYIGRIYKQETHMYRLFAQMKGDMEKLDELDLLNTLIEKTKERHDAQISFDKWKDNSRIDRRIKDIKLIFEFNRNYSSPNYPFNITPVGLQQIVDKQKIKSYFDLGCGDGTITAGIGTYLGLTKSNIFGGDIYEGQNKDITFIKVNENQSTITLPDNRVDLITAFVTFHHLSHVKVTFKELTRILRPGGYLILREHDCRNEHIFSAKYLNFVHAIMMIARVGEFADSSSHHYIENQHVVDDYENETDNWKEQKSRIIEYTKSIHYRTCDEWQEELGNVGFRLCATLYYGVDGSSNPQKLFYAVYQLDKK